MTDRQSERAAEDICSRSRLTLRKTNSPALSTFRRSPTILAYLYSVSSSFFRSTPPSPCLPAYALFLLLFCLLAVGLSAPKPKHEAHIYTHGSRKCVTGGRRQQARKVGWCLFPKPETAGEYMLSAASLSVVETSYVYVCAASTAAAGLSLSGLGGVGRGRRPRSLSRSVSLSSDTSGLEPDGRHCLRSWVSSV